MTTSVHICSPTAIAVLRRVMWCHHCGLVRRFTIFDNGWWGSDMICHACGTCYRPGEPVRIVAPDVATTNKAKAKTGWDHPYDHSDRYWDEHREPA